MTTKKRDQLTLKDRLSRLRFIQASKLLGSDGASLIRQGGKYEIDMQDVSLTDRRFRLVLPEARVTISLGKHRNQRLDWQCSMCSGPCEHVGAAFSLILEEKMALGLAAPPTDKLPIELLTEAQLLERMLREREKRASEEKMTMKAIDPDKLWSDYLLTSQSSGKTYRVAVRGWERGESYCSCPDFRTNTLGTCKHIVCVLKRLRKRFPAGERNKPYRRKGISIHLHYGKDVELRMLLPDRIDKSIARIVAPIRNRPVSDVHDLIKRVRKLEKSGHAVNVYPDAEEYINQKLMLDQIQHKVEEIRKNPSRHSLRKDLLKTELLPYQLDGIAFAVGAGRAILADDMGLGKTIQGIGIAELLRREVGIEKVLIVCPASVKAQWRSEIRKFSDNSCGLVLGKTAERARQYGNGAFFTVCNYEQVLRDILAIENVKWDLIVLDEGQRIKNWEAKTTRVIKGLRSPFALVLSGTPLENRLDELFSVASFIDERRLGPAFHFFHRHRVVDEHGKVLGYKNMKDLRNRLKPMLLRRTRASVLQQLPPRMTEVVRITATDEQLALHTEHMRVVSAIVKKKYISEMDLLRLQKALLMCRLAANSTLLVTKEGPGYSSKIERIGDLVRELHAEEARKTVLFSEWTGMLDLIEPVLKEKKLKFVRLDGSVPQKKRQTLVAQFREDPECKLFVTTNAGATGLNLQSANTVINVDLPWNPAVLEQRIARAHRMGQKRPVQVFVLITEGTIEERLLERLAAKQELSLAALDPDSDMDEVSLESGMEELKRRLEVLLGAAPEAEPDVSVAAREEQIAMRKKERKERMSLAGGQLVTAAFNFLGEMIPDGAGATSSEMVDRFREQLSGCLEQDEDGRMCMKIAVQDKDMLNTMAESLARLASFGATGN